MQLGQVPEPEVPVAGKKRPAEAQVANSSAAKSRKGDADSVMGSENEEEDTVEAPHSGKFGLVHCPVTGKVAGHIALCVWVGGLGGVGGVGGGGVMG